MIRSLARSKARAIPRPLALPFVRGGGAVLDPDTAAFRDASGATQLSGIDAIAKYMRAEGLRNNYRLYPKKSAQNAGSGSTVFGIGGLTANNMTLANSPTWGSSGIAFNTTNQFAHISDFLDAETITVICRRSGTLGAGGTWMFGQWDFAANHRSFGLLASGSTISAGVINRSSDGGSTNSESYATPSGYLQTADASYVTQWTAGGGRSAWGNKILQSLSLTSGTAQTNRFNSAASIMLNAVGTPASAAGFMGGTYTAFCVVRGTLTTTQRETLTDLVNAL